MVDADVIVIGGGHAGLEAAAAASRLGAATVMVTLEASAIGRLSCNPAIGGIGKGHLVREIHALGGLMGRAADRTGIQFRLLNTSRGPSVRGPRAQVDREAYPGVVRALLDEHRLEVLEGEVGGLLMEQGAAAMPTRGVRLTDGRELRAHAVVLASGTFLGGRLHVGAEQSAGGRRGERAATVLARALQAAGLPLRRFKTGTPPRLHAESVRWSELEAQWGDARPTFFCPETRSPALPQRPCHLAYTTPRAHEVILSGLDRSPLAQGRITGRGPRYCPSFEEKVLRFRDRDRHLLILEPDGLTSDLVYVNGASTSLPAEVQERFVRLIPGLEDARLAQHGYAVEYDHVPPTEVRSSLECRRLPGLFLAGQVLGTTGYEEAAGLGLMAGTNAALRAQGRRPFELGRDEGYLGVMVSDLVTRGIDEPYRMFTSRAEHRLRLGIDSADLRLAPRGADVGLIPGSRAAEAERRQALLLRAERLLEELPAGGGSTLADMCRRPETDLDGLLTRIPEAQRPTLGAPDERQRTLVQAAQAIRHRTYVQRQERTVRRWPKVRRRAIPPDFDYRTTPGLSAEVQERLAAARPETLEQASRLPGITPAALQLLDALLTADDVPRGTSGCRVDS